MTFVVAILAGVALGMFTVLWLDARRRQEQSDREREQARRRAQARHDADDWFGDWTGRR